MKIDNTLYSYKQIKDKLLKYKKEYEHDLFGLSEEFESSKIYIKGHISMIDILLDDLDASSGIAWLGVDLAEPNPDPIPYRRKMCEGNCEECIFATKAKEYYLKNNDSSFDAVDDYKDFIGNCKEKNGVK